MTSFRLSPLLRWALLADAVASGATGLLMMLAAGPLEGLLAVPASLLHYAGLGLLPYAALVAYFGTRKSLPRQIVWAVIICNALWVVDSLLLSFGGWIAPTALGYAFIIGQAVVVALFADLQYLGLRRSAPAMA